MAVQVCIPTSSLDEPFSPYTLQHLLVFIFLIMATLTDVRWSFTVVLIFISLMTSCVEHISMNLLGTTSIVVLWRWEQAHKNQLCTPHSKVTFPISMVVTWNQSWCKKLTNTENHSFFFFESQFIITFLLSSSLTFFMLLVYIATFQLGTFAFAIPPPEMLFPRISQSSSS